MTTVKKAKAADNLLIFHIEGFNYGLWQSDINDIISGLRKLHKLPYFPKRVAGMSTIEVDASSTSEAGSETTSGGRTGTFFDLGFCLGHKKFNTDKGGCLFTIGSRSAKKPLEGFAAPSPPETIKIDKKELLLMPKVMDQAELLGCIVTGRGLVPVIDIKSLYKGVKEKDWTLPTFHISTDNLKEKKSDSHRVFTLPGGSGDLDYAIRDSFIDKDKLKIESTCKVKFAPPHVECFALTKGELIVVFNAGVLAGASRPSLDDGTIFAMSTEGLGLLVGRDRGATKTQAKEIVEIARTGIVSSVIVKEKNIVPILNLKELLSGTGGIKTEKPVYKTRVNEFLASFGKEEQALLQFTIRGLKQAIPRAEEDDSFPLKQWRPIEGLPQIVLGVVEHKGEILPVLDPAVCFGTRTANPYEKMVLLKKEGFKAFIITEDKPVSTLVDPSNQKRLPMAMDKDYVYGCYVEGDSVGLVLNMEALVLDFDEEEFKEFFGAALEEMEIEGEPDIKDVIDVTGEKAEVAEHLKARGVGELAALPQEIETDLGVESSVESSEEFGEESSDKLKIDASIFEGVKAEDHSREVVTSEEKPNIKEEFLKYQKSLENPETKDIKDSKDTKDTKETEKKDKPSKEETEYLDYEEEVKENNEDKVLEVEVEAEENIAKDPNALSFSSRASETEFKAPEIGKNRESRDTSQENKRLLLMLAGAVIVITILAMLFSSTGGDKEVIRGVVIESSAKEDGQTPDDLVKTGEAAALEKAEEAEVKGSAPQILIEIDPANEEISITKLEKNAPKPIGAEIYVVVEGDTLWHIARRLTGNPFNYPKLAKSSQIKNPDLIYPKQKIYVKVIEG